MASDPFSLFPLTIAPPSPTALGMCRLLVPCSIMLTALQSVHPAPSAEACTHRVPMPDSNAMSSSPYARCRSRLPRADATLVSRAVPGLSASTARGCQRSARRRRSSAFLSGERGRIARAPCSSLPPLCVPSSATHTPLTNSSVIPSPPASPDRHRHS